MEIGLRACVSDQLDFATSMAQLEKRVEKLEGGKVE
jgi:exonuclease VII small subunit